MQIIHESGAQAVEGRAAQELAAAHAFSGEAWPGWSQEAAAQALLADMGRAGEVWAVLDGGGWQWMAAQEELAFDSKLFGRRMIKVMPIAHREAWPQPEAMAQGRAMLEALAQAAGADGAQCLVARVPVRDMLAAQALEAAGWRLVDVSVEWMLELDGLAQPSARLGGAAVRAWRPDEEEVLKSLAAASFCDLGGYADRFAMDPRLRGQCPELYRRWLANSFSGDQADQVLVLEREDEVLGFISLRLPSEGDGPEAGCGWVVLNAIAPAARGRGLYHGLLHRGLAWLAKHRASRARVRTKISQPAVIRAWASLGARQVYSDLTFHNWLD